MSLKLSFFGAAGTVTGSKFLLETNRTRILIDCGLFQGVKELRLQNRAPFPVDPATIDAVVLTHAHLDHCGYIPLLVKTGFKGEIHMTSPTRDLAKIILMDSAHIQEEDARDANEMGYSKHTPARPLYDTKDATRSLKSFATHPTDKWIDLGDHLKLKFTPNGHILGSCFVTIEYKGTRVVFSGDVGRTRPILMNPPAALNKADFLIVESTYGDRLHPREPAIKSLERIIKETHARKGKLLIPSFAIGRAQDLMYLLAQLARQKKLPKVPIYLDSPMAIDATQIFADSPDWHILDEEAVSNMCAMVTMVRSKSQSSEVMNKKGPAIIIAGSGMITGGRILHHLERHMSDPRTTVLLTGFQAAGTRGRLMLDGMTELKMLGKYLPVGARIEYISSLSAHADQGEMLSWLKQFKAAPKKTYIVHGEPQAANALRVRISDDLGWDCYIPKQMETVKLI